MYLNPEEEKIYRGERGETLEKAIGILVALGDIYGADRLIPIKSAQIAGVSYKTIGEAGLEWIESLDGKVKVPSILNPAGMDLLAWKEMGVSPDFAQKQHRIIKAYERLGIGVDCTCTPYYFSSPSFGDHLAWSESSAVSYANSIIGARTNREGGPSALAAALLGKTANYGLHIESNRAPSLLVEVDCGLGGADFGALGIIVGKEAGSRIPLFRLRERPQPAGLKALGAAMAASGAVALYHVAGVTPEAGAFEPPAETFTVTREDIDAVLGGGCEPELIAFGCPHCSAAELRRLARLLHGKKVKKEVWVFTSRATGEGHPGLVDSIRASGAKVFYDTCMVVSPASNSFRCIMVDSGKAHAYIPGMCGAQSMLASTEDCVRAAVN